MNRDPKIKGAIPLKGESGTSDAGPAPLLQSEARR